MKGVVELMSDDAALESCQGYIGVKHRDSCFAGYSIMSLGTLIGRLRTIPATIIMWWAG